MGDRRKEQSLAQAVYEEFFCWFWLSNTADSGAGVPWSLAAKALHIREELMLSSS